jgi:thiol-disulfide isomerase/thioredoxin
MPRATKKKNSTTRGIMGSIMPPVDVNSDEMMGEFVKRMKKGPVTLVLVYAPWCGHCVQYKPEFEKMVNTPNRNIQVAQLRDDMVNKAPLKNANINSYPSVILVNKEGEVVEEVQDRNNTQKMNQILEEGTGSNVGANTGANANSITNQIEQYNDLSKPTKNNVAADIANEMEPVATGNVTVPNMQNDSKSANMSKKNTDSLVYKAAGGGCGCPFTRATQAGGSGLYGLLSSVATGALPAAALLGTAAVLAKSKSKTRKQKKASRKTKRSRITRK